MQLKESGKQSLSIEMEEKIEKDREREPRSIGIDQRDMVMGQ